MTYFVRDYKIGGIREMTVEEAEFRAKEEVEYLASLSNAAEAKAAIDDITAITLDDLLPMYKEYLTRKAANV